MTEEELEVCCYCGNHPKETYCFQAVKDEEAGTLCGCVGCGETYYGCELDDDGRCSECQKEELDYCEECYKTVRDIFVVDDNRCDGAKWCNQECLNKYWIKKPPLANCQDCYIKEDVRKLVNGFCKLCC